MHCDLYLWAQLASVNTCCLGIQGRALPSVLHAWGHAKQAACGLPHLMPWSSNGTFPPATCCPYSLPGDKANLPWKVRRSTGKTNTSAVPLSPCSQPSHLTFLYSRVNDLVPTSHKVPKGMKVGCCGRSQRRKWPSWTWCHRISNLILSRAKENWRRGQGVKGSGSWADWSGQSVWERQPSLNW